MLVMNAKLTIQTAQPKQEFKLHIIDSIILVLLR